MKLDLYVENKMHLKINKKGKGKKHEKTTISYSDGTFYVHGAAAHDSHGGGRRNAAV